MWLLGEAEKAFLHKNDPCYGLDDEHWLPPVETSDDIPVEDLIGEDGQDKETKDDLLEEFLHEDDEVVNHMGYEFGLL